MRKQVLIFALTLAMLISALPVSAFAAVTKQEKSSGADKVFIVGEDYSKRSEFGKHYICSDGTYMAVSYPEAVHYKNNNGEWIEVNNTFISNGNSYKNANDNFKVSFSKEFSGQQLVSLSQGIHTLTWSLGAYKKDIEIETNVRLSSIAPIESKTFATNSERLITDNASFDIPHMLSKITYDDVFDSDSNISLNYTVYQNKIEEDIIINQKSDITSFALKVNNSGLTPRVNNDNSVDFLDGYGKMIYHIGIPYMVDANDSVLSDIQVRVKTSLNEHLIIYSPALDWLQSEDRAYPIMLDPSITTNEYTASIEDTYISEGETINHSTEQRLYVGIKSSKTTRIYMKVNHLPEIDTHMPILNATMSLRMWQGTSTGKQVSIYKVNSNWNASSITYSNQPSIGTLLSVSAFNSSTLMHTFNLTDNIARLYDEYLAGTNYGYCIKYTDESKSNPDYNSIYSSEMTTASYKPYISINYGYKLPEKLSSGNIYSLYNYGSGSYVTVHNGQDSNGTNVYQSSATTSTLITSQEFKLEYVSSSGAYRFRAMCSSNGTGRVLDIDRSSDEIYNGSNIQLFSATDPISQEWFIVGTSNGTFKIIPKANHLLAMAVVPSYDNGTASGITSTSPGNVYLATYANSPYQEWYFVEDGKYIRNSNVNSVFDNSVLYINNSHTGKYIHKNGSLVNTTSGLINSLQDTIRWKVTMLSTNIVTFQSADNMSLYLVESSSGGSVALESFSGTTIPDRFCWKVSLASGGGCLLKNCASSKYLYNSGTYVGISDTLGTAGTTTYSSRAWRAVSVDDYSNASSTTWKEMSAYTDFEDVSCMVGQSRYLNTVEYYEDELWCSAKDFTYSYNTAVASIDSLTGKIKALSVGSIIITATHKPTGRVVSFNFTVSPLPIYQTRETYENDEYGNYAEDLMVGDLSKDQLREKDWINWSDFLLSTPNSFRSSWEDLARLVSSGDMQDVVLDMIDHFMDGSGSVYTNSILTSEAENHDSTQQYIANVQRELQELLNEYEGDITSFLYEASTRDSNPLKIALSEAGVFQPVFDETADNLNGLGMAVHSLWGNKIDVVSYVQTENTYTCTLRYTLYDHFGLNEADIEKFGILAGFRAWYILQHYEEYNQAYKPFLTLMEFEVTFTGNIS